MAKRRRPEPEVTARWTATLRTLAQKLARRRRLADEAQDELGAAIRAAFAEGVLVGPIKEATGLSGSRAYQYKFLLRDQERKNVS